MTSKFAGLGLPTEVTSKMPILHPYTGQPLRDKDGTAAFIELHSTDSMVAKNHERAVMNRRLKDRITKPSAELAEADSIELYVVLTKTWYLLTLDGEPLDLECTPANARDLYTVQELVWLKEQVSQWVSDRANFPKN